MSDEEDSEDKEENEDCSPLPSLSNDPEFYLKSSDIHFIIEDEMHGLVKDLELSKNKV